ncbi:probable elongation factor 1-delta isoform X2 [Drosophila obscura]|uniref:probable elongation factor 1-delta isoform X2 n=1 Tax=Drosophila obscura TaxID=7282 RepID=UPI000BA0BC3F|nr:probable elongation factor 1-delta isoform X2 [Drosophila obscura]
MRVEALDIFWTDKSRYDLAEKRFHEVILKIDVATLEDRWRLEFLDRISLLENQNGDLKSQVFKLNQAYTDVLKRIDMVENRLNFSNGNLKEDDVDLFASDSEEETKEAVRIREERLAAYKAKKSNKAIIVAKSSLILDVKPWDDETDLLAMEIEIRKIALEGLLWGASKLVPVAFGIKKLSISCVVEDDKVSIDWLTEEIEKLEDFVQSVDIATFNKI